MVGDTLCLLPVLLIEAATVLPTLLHSFISVQFLALLFFSLPLNFDFGQPMFWQCLLNDALMCD